MVNQIPINSTFNPNTYNIIHDLKPYIKKILTLGYKFFTSGTLYMYRKNIYLRRYNNGK